MKREWSLLLRQQRRRTARVTMLSMNASILLVVNADRIRVRLKPRSTTFSRLELSIITKREVTDQYSFDKSAPIYGINVGNQNYRRFAPWWDLKFRGEFTGRIYEPVLHRSQWVCRFVFTTHYAAMETRLIRQRPPTLHWIFHIHSR